LSSILEKRYSDALNAYIIGNNFNPEDKSSLYAHYSQYGELTKESIRMLAITDSEAGEIISQNMRTDDTLLSVLLQSDDIARNLKIHLFVISIPKP